MADIFVVEDDSDLGSLLQASLEGAGHVVTLFPDADAAIEAFEVSPVDVVVTDMIFMDNGRASRSGGITVSFRVKAMAAAQGKRVLVVAISGAVQNAGLKSLLTAAQQVGADTALEKPFPPDELLEVINDWLGQA